MSPAAYTVLRVMAGVSKDKKLASGRGEEEPLDSNGWRKRGGCGVYGRERWAIRCEA